MPISENELMWNASGTEDERVEVIDRSLEEPSEASSALDSVEEPPVEAEEPVVRVEAATRLEATLARLEMNSLDMKLYLDSIEQRIARIEPLLQSLPHGVLERLASAPTTSSESAKQMRWAHLVGPEVEEIVLGQVEPASQVPSWTASDTPPDAARRAGAARETRWSQMRDAEHKDPGMTAVDAAAVSLPAPSLLPLAPEVDEPNMLLAEPAQVENMGGKGGSADAELIGSDSAVAATTAETTTGPHESRVPVAPVRTLETAYDRQTSVADEGARGPRMWRGYRVLHLALGFVLLILGIVPAAIWWRASTATHVPDGGDVVATSAENAQSSSVSDPRRPDTIAGNSTSQRPETDASKSGRITEPAAREDLRRAKSEAGLSPEASSAPTTPVGRSDGHRVQETAGTAGAPPGATAAGMAGGQGGGDIVPGTSAGRVRVASDVMAGHLLPVEETGSPEMAESHERGDVVVALFISNTGRVEDVQAISGQSSLRGSALRTIRNWRYEPYVQGGIRVPVVTTATIRFAGDAVAP